MSFFGKVAGILPGTDWNEAKRLADAVLGRLRQCPRDNVEVGSAYDPIVMKAIELMMERDPLVQVLPWEPPRVVAGEVVQVEPTMTVGLHFGVGNVFGREAFDAMRDAARAMTRNERHLIRRLLEAPTTRQATASIERAHAEGAEARGLLKL